MGFDYVQGWIQHNFSGQHDLMLDHSDSKEDYFSYVLMEFTVIQFVCIAFCAVTGHH